MGKIIIILKNNSGMVSSIIPAKAFVASIWILVRGYESMEVMDFDWF